MKIAMLSSNRYPCMHFHSVMRHAILALRPWRAARQQPMRPHASSLHRLRHTAICVCPCATNTYHPRGAVQSPLRGVRHYRRRIQMCSQAISMPHSAAPSIHRRTQLLRRVVITHAAAIAANAMVLAPHAPPKAIITRCCLIHRPPLSQRTSIEGKLSGWHHTHTRRSPRHPLSLLPTSVMGMQ